MSWRSKKWFQPSRRGQWNPPWPSSTEVPETRSKLILEKKWWIFFRQLLSKTTLIFDHFQLNTVSLSRHFQNIDTSQGLIHLRWCRISAINSSSYKIQAFIYGTSSLGSSVCSGSFVSSGSFAIIWMFSPKKKSSQTHVEQTNHYFQPLYQPPKTNMTME